MSRKQAIACVRFGLYRVLRTLQLQGNAGLGVFVPQNETAKQRQFWSLIPEHLLGVKPLMWPRKTPRKMVVSYCEASFPGLLFGI